MNHFTNLRGTPARASAMLLLLCVGLFGSTALCAAPNATMLDVTAAEEAVAGPKIRFENLTKLPGTTRSFPETDFMTFHRILFDKNTAGQTVRVHDTNILRIYNDGGQELVISNITTSNSKNFVTEGLSIPSGGIRVAPGRSTIVKIRFVTKSGPAHQVITETLRISSNAVNSSDVVTLRGAYMRRLEGGWEINAQQVIESFGFSTKMGRRSNGRIVTRPASEYPSADRVNSGIEGDMILAEYFVAADPSKPVTMVQLGAFHGPGRSGNSARYANGRNTGLRFFHDELSHQALFPRLEGDIDQIAHTSAIVTDSFYLSIGNYRSTGGGYNGAGSSSLLGVRSYIAIDRDGKVIPNEYIVNMDYVGNGCGEGNHNCDWNDNAIYLMNARPVGVPKARRIDPLTVRTQTAVSYNVGSFFSRGYPGNRLTYKARLTSGGALPSWVTVDTQNGRIRVNAPNSSIGSALEIEVVATGLNKLTAKSSFTLKVEQGAAGGPQEFWLEAECADVGSAFEIQGNSRVAGEVVFRNSGYSSIRPPRDEAKNRVRFTVNNVTGGSYHLFGHVRADKSSLDSYWVRVNGGAWFLWYWRVIDEDAFAWAEVFPKAILLKGGTNTIDFAFREPRVFLDKIHLNQTGLTPVALGSAGQNCGSNSTQRDVFWLEAECAQIGGAFVTGKSSMASEGRFVYNEQGFASDAPPTDNSNNRVRFAVANAAAGTYSLFVHGRSDGSERNSYWVRVNGGNWKVLSWNKGNSSRTLAWSNGQFKIRLNSGNNTVDFAYREPMAFLDKVHIARGGQRPSGMGALASNCTPDLATPSVVVETLETEEIDLGGPITGGVQGPGVTTTVPTGEPSQALSIFPNPVAETLSVQVVDQSAGAVRVSVYGMWGEQLQQYTFAKAAGSFTAQIPVGDLIPGTYMLRLATEAGQQQSMFVKAR